MSAYRYWRVKATTMHGSSGGYMACQELLMLTDWDGVQAATGGTPISDSFLTGYPASAAFNGAADIFSTNGTGTAGYIGYDFGTAVTLKEIWYTPRADSSYQQIFTAANIDGSPDGVTWTTVVSWTPATWAQGATQSIVVQGTKPADGTSGVGAHRYWRVLARTLHASANAIMSCQQLNWRISSGGSQQASGGAPLRGSQVDSSHGPDKAYDNSRSTQWTSAAIGWDWVGYDFTVPIQIAELTYTSRDDATLYTQIFTSAVVQSSDDGVIWTTAATLTPATWSRNQTQTFTVQAAAGTVTVVNAADTILQATSPRMVAVNLPTSGLTPTLKSLALNATTNIFKVDTLGVSTPTSITINAVLTQISGTVNFSVTTGAATLVQSGNSCSVAYSGMTSSTAVITATVTDTDGTVYTATITLVKVTDGASSSGSSLSGFWYGSVTNLSGTVRDYPGITGHLVKVTGFASAQVPASTVITIRINGAAVATVTMNVGDYVNDSGAISVAVSPTDYFTADIATVLAATNPGFRMDFTA